ncbi:MAG: NADH-quinone oxidoreductase subunit J [Chitinophaga sp.]|jgi:NADH-quinone oxidoreductase subunit J|nr:NADH-quinone oxidoreductase subunit J [Chitinophaga sp.]
MKTVDIIFYCIAAFVLTTGLLAVTTRKIFRSAIWLLFCLMGIAALYFWMNANFIAAIQIAVYVGGIVVLIIFSIFLTQQAGNQMPKPNGLRIAAASAASLIGFGLIFQLFKKHTFQTTGNNFDIDIATIGKQLLSIEADGYALPFEVISILLLAAMVGCIVIAMKPKTEV